LRNTSEKGLVLVGIVTSLDHDAGRELIDVAERLDTKKLGKCIIIEANMNALALLDTAKKHNVEKILLIVGASRSDVQQGIQHYYSGKPGQSLVSLNEINRMLWANLTGSLDVDDYINALMILSDRPYDVYVCNKWGASGVNCGEVTEEFIKEFCVGTGDRQ